MNWKVRIKNRVFWVSFIPMILLLGKQIAGVFGYELKIEGISSSLVAIAETIFACLGLLGVVTDPTTEGIGDSDRAMSYEEPSK